MTGHRVPWAKSYRPHSRVDACQDVLGSGHHPTELLRRRAAGCVGQQNPGSVRERLCGHDSGGVSAEAQADICGVRVAGRWMFRPPTCSWRSRARAALDPMRFARVSISRFRRCRVYVAVAAPASADPRRGDSTLDFGQLKPGEPRGKDFQLVLTLIAYRRSD